MDLRASSRGTFVVAVTIFTAGAMPIGGCSPSAPLTGAEGELIVLTPSPLALPPVWVGAGASGVVELSNPGRIDRAVSVGVQAPFTVDVPTEGLRMAAGSQRKVAVHFRPKTTGAHSASILFTSEGTELKVEVTGIGLEPPSCDATSSCARAFFDAEAGRCEVESAPDGTPCEDACLLAPTCFAGQCTGRARSCDDGNPCTEDSCSSTAGCVSVAMTCEAPESPCLAALCDPIVGCTQAPVEDGTPCGRRECAVRDVCIAGACVEREAPDGAPCGHPSPCQALGVCTSGTCVRPPAQTLQPEWTRPISHHAQRLPVDPDGNLYSVHRSPHVRGQQQTTTLLSLAPDGVLRWEVPLPAGSLHVEASAVLDDVVFAIEGESEYSSVAVHGFRRSDGAHLWRRELLPDVLPLLESPPEPADGYMLNFPGLIETAGGKLGVPVHALAVRPWKAHSVGGFIADLDPHTGTLLRLEKVARGFNSGNQVVDRAGNLYLDVSIPSPSGGVDYGALALAPSMQQRWFESNRLPRGVSAGLLGVGVPGTACASGMAVLETGSGTVMSTQPPLLSGWRYEGHSMVMTAGAAFQTIAGPQPAPNVCSGTWSMLRRFDLATGAEGWRRTLGTWTEGTVLPPLLSDAATVIVASGERVPNPGGGNAQANLTLFEFDLDGAERWACPLSAPIEPWYSEPVLAGGRWVIFDNRRSELVALPVLGRRPAPSGWLNAAGNPQRTSRER